MNEIVSVEWLNQNLNDENLIILDASLTPVTGGLDSELSNKTIPFARFFDLKNNFSDTGSPFPNTFPSTEKFELECRKLGINKSSKIVVFDDLGIYSSPRVWWMLKVMGHNKVFLLNGGLPEWIKKGYLTVEKKSNNYKLGDFKASFQQQFVSTYEDVLANTKNNSFLLIDTRSSGRFNGTEKEPREHLKSGSIANSVNIPYNEVLENGKFKPQMALKELFESKCATSKEVVFSCGSGLTACIVMLASEIAYKKSKRVYDGSWSEWAELQNLITKEA